MEDGLVLHATGEPTDIKIKVLILIVVEDGLVRSKPTVCKYGRYVLILVVVEDGLVLAAVNVAKTVAAVLILVVVEDGLVPVGCVCEITNN